MDGRARSTDADLQIRHERRYRVSVRLGRVPRVVVVGLLVVESVVELVVRRRAALPRCRRGERPYPSGGEVPANRAGRPEVLGGQHCPVDGADRGRRRGAAASGGSASTKTETAATAMAMNVRQVRIDIRIQSRARSRVFTGVLREVASLCGGWT